MTSTKKFLSFLLVLALSLAMMTGCANNSDDSANTNSSSNSTSDSAATNNNDSTDSTSSDDIFRIGYAFNTLDETRVLMKGYIEAWDAEREDVEVLFTNAEGRVDKQMSDCESLLAMGIDVLCIIALDVDGIAPIVDTAHAIGVPVVALEDEIRHDELDMHTGLHNYQLGAYSGKVVNMYLEENPDLELKVGFLLGDLMYQEVPEAREGTMDEIQENIDSGRITILSELSGEWTHTKSMSVTEDWLVAYPEMNCIIAQSDEMALGCLEALQAAGKTIGKDFYLFGRDGSPRGIAAVQNGDMSGTMLIDYKANTLRRINLVVEKFKDGKDLPYNPEGDLSKVFIPCTGTNIDQVVAEHPQ